MNCTSTSIEKQSLLQLASIRRSVWNTKALHPRLIHMEMVAHQTVCQEYNIDILKHLIELENKTRSSWTSFQSQPELTVQMRTLIFDFIMCCHTRLGLSSSTLFLCYNIMDRYCSKIIVKSPTYQLLGLTALWLASKFADKKPRIPSLQNLCCHQYTKQQFKEMELHILKSLNWSVCSAPTHDSFVDILLKTKIAKLNFRSLNLNDLKYGAMILCELSCFDPNLNYNYNSSAIALASVTIIICALRLENLGEFQHYNQCTSDVNLIIICRQLLEQLESEERFPSSFNLKYSTKDGSIQTNPIMHCLFAYYSRINEEEKRSTEDYLPHLRSPSLTATYESNVNCKEEIAKRRGVTPLGYTSPNNNHFQLPAIKNFVPPTPTTPNTSAVAAVLPCSKLISETSCTPEITSAVIQKIKGPVQPQQRTPPIQNQNSHSQQQVTTHTKRSTSVLDIDFFDMDQVMVKRLR